MKINHKILSLPPYISTSWKNVLSLHLEPREGSASLIIGLVNGSTIEVPQLDKAILQAIFAAHEKHLEQESAAKTPSPSPTSGSQTIIGIPLNMGMEGFDQLGSMMQHNPEASGLPDLPPEVLEKVSMLGKMIGLDAGDTLPKPEPHCNCMHCQIVRSLGSAESSPSDEEPDSLDEPILDSDLKFREWDVKEVSDKVFTVSNPLHTEEHYNVFLGTPIGCTCGEKNCEHVRAVLNS